MKDASRVKDAAARRSKPKIDLIVFDFDGVLTDNRVMVFQDGTEAVLCSRSDGMAFDLFRAAGQPVLILSTERNPVVAARAKKLKVPVLQDVQDKAVGLAKYCKDQGWPLAAVMYVGNDVNDLAAMQSVGYPAAVADAHPCVRKVAKIRLRTRGGEGVAREIAERVLGLNGPELWSKRPAS